MDFKSKFLELLKEKNKGNYSEFSLDTNIPKTTISGWLNKNQTPRAEHLVVICKYFDVSSDFLLGLRESENGFEKMPSFYSRHELQLLYKLKKLSDEQLELVDNFIRYLINIENQFKK